MGEPTGYTAKLATSWTLTVTAFDGETMAWLTHPTLDTGFYECVRPGETLIDLDLLGYVPTVYHDGGDAPPLVLFHAPRLDLPPYVWEPRSGRLYQAGSDGHA